MSFGTPVPNIAKKERPCPDWMKWEISEQTKREIAEIDDNIRRAAQSAHLLMLD